MRLDFGLGDGKIVLYRSVETRECKRFFAKINTKKSYNPWFPPAQAVISGCGAFSLSSPRQFKKLRLWNWMRNPCSDYRTLTPKDEPRLEKEVEL